VWELLGTRAALAHVEATGEGTYATRGESEGMKKGVAEPVRTFRRLALICRFFLAVSSWGVRRTAALRIVLVDLSGQP
jgi:hypothetical protein